MIINTKKIHTNIAILAFTTTCLGITGCNNNKQFHQYYHRDNTIVSPDNQNKNTQELRVFTAPKDPEKNKEKNKDGSQNYKFYMPKHDETIKLKQIEQNSSNVPVIIQ